MEASALPPSVALARTRLALGSPLLRLRSDEQLVSLFRGGSEEAFRAIHDRYRQRMFAYTRQMLTGSAVDAEDAVQEIFVRAYSGLRSSDRELALRAWLYRIAHNRCIDELRRPQSVATETIPATVPNQSADPVARLEQRDALKRLIADVQRLPDQQRSALLMRELAGMTYADVAGALGVSVPAVKSLLVRARVGLAQASEARDTACARIREDLIVAHDRGVRASGLARRHLRDCPHCRQFRTEVRGVSRQLAAFVPALGPIGVIAKVLGIGGGGGAAAGTGAIAGSGATAAATTAAGGLAGSGGVRRPRRHRRHRSRRDAAGRGRGHRRRRDRAPAHESTGPAARASPSRCGAHAVACRAAHGRRRSPRVGLRPGDQPGIVGPGHHRRRRHRLQHLGRQPAGLQRLVHERRPSPLAVERQVLPARASAHPDPRSRPAEHPVWPGHAAQHRRSVRPGEPARDNDARLDVRHGWHLARHAYRPERHRLDHRHVIRDTDGDGAAERHWDRLRGQRSDRSRHRFHGEHPLVDQQHPERVVEHRGLVDEHERGLERVDLRHR